MPTGYTAGIADGISFEKFVLTCSRAMGALVSMRDEPMDAPIPESIGSSDYHDQKLTRLHAEYERLKEMTPEQADAEAKLEYETELSAHEKRINENAELLKKYEVMLAQVKSWRPPTSEHIVLKDFMIEQITESISFDCNISYFTKPELLDGMVWLRKSIDKVVKDIGYHSQEKIKDEERNRARNAWIKQLRESLISPQPTVTLPTNESK